MPPSNVESSLPSNVPVIPKSIMAIIMEIIAINCKPASPEKMIRRTLFSQYVIKKNPRMTIPTKIASD